MSEKSRDAAFSTIRFFKVFEREIGKIDEFPLDLRNLVVHKENFSMLGGDESSEDGGFAHLGFDVPTGDMVLLFSVDFFERACLVSFDGQPHVELLYEQIDPSEAKAAKKLVEVLKAAANGQLLTLLSCTEDDERIQAVEVMYREGDSTTVLATYPLFQSARKLKQRDMTHFIHRNQFAVGDSTADTTVLRTLLPEQEFRSFNRTVVGTHFMPLTRQAWEESVQTFYDAEYADKVIAKVDAWSKSGPQGSFKDIYFEYAEKRHLNLTLSMMIAGFVLSFGVGLSGISVSLFVGLVVVWGVAMSLRHHALRHFFHAPLGYVSVVLMSTSLVLNQSEALFYYLLVGFVAIETIECVALDIREWLKSR